jgi:hypothetical protein
MDKVEDNEAKENQDSVKQTEEDFFSSKGA